MSSSSPQNPNPNPKPKDSWTIVSRRRNRIPTPIPWTPLDSESDPARQSKLHLELQSSLEKVCSSKFYRQFVSQLHSPKIQSLLSSFHHIDLIVYGIGKIESSKDSRLQLSLALLLRRQLGARISSVEVFDPILSATECSVLEELGFPVMRFDELARREVKVPTLFFMPHCELHLYENLLSTNWGKGLRRMAILGNSFGGYRRYVEAGAGIAVIIKETGPTMMGMRQFVQEVEMEGVGRRKEEEEEFEFFIAFSNMSWHFFELGDNCDVNNFLE